MELEHSKDPQPLTFNQEDCEIDTVYSSERILGKGTFGVVYKCRVGDSDTFCAIKRVFADPNSHQREWELLKKLQHPNIVKLIHCFYTKAEGGGREININYVFEYLTTSLYRLIRNGFKNKQKIPILDTKVYMYQILRGLAYIHSHGVCHRDIKPLNVIVNPDARVAKICDFGSAKELKNINSNTTYIESRYYRAPELIFGNSDYSLSIDIWAVGCTFAEMLTGDVFFHGDNNISQLYEIMKVLGNPSSHDITSMNPSYSEFNLPTIETKKWHLNFPAETCPEALKLLKKMLVYNPTARISALEALCHPFFDELRLEDTKLDPTEDGEEVPMPALFNFTEEEKERMDEDILSQLIPDWYTED